MSRSNWLLIAAVVGLALQPIGNRCHAQGGAPEGQNIADKTTQPVAPLDLAPLYERLERIDERIQAVEPKPETADEYRRAEGDLKAQEDMAWWAMLMFYATAFSAAVSALGVGLIIFTLRQNARSIRIALMSVKRSNEAVHVARQTAERQLRAYVTFNDGTAVTIGNSILLFSLRFMNTGQTPAYGIVGRGCAAILQGTGRPTFDMSQISAATGNLSVVGNNQEYVINIRLDAERQDLEAVRHEMAKAYVWGEVLYNDAFGRPQRHFRFRCVTGFKTKDDSEARLISATWRIDVHDRGCEAN